MARKPKDDTPSGGWDCPGVPDLSIKPIKYAAGSKRVRGKLEWIWKPVTDQYLADCAERKAKAGLPPEPPKIRVRTRHKT